MLIIKVEYTPEQVDQHYYTVDANNPEGVRKPIMLGEHLEIEYKFFDMKAPNRTTFTVMTPVAAGVGTSSPERNDSLMEFWLEDVSTKLHHKLSLIHSANVSNSASIYSHT